MSNALGWALNRNPKARAAMDDLIAVAAAETGLAPTSLSQGEIDRLADRAHDRVIAAFREDGIDLTQYQ